MGKIGKTCCKCIHPCGSYCIASNPATTTLQISGNHSATLILPITYEVTNDEGLLENNCVIEGQAEVDHDLSTDSLETECRYVKSVAYDGIDVKIEKCCDPNWVTVFDGSIETFQKASTIYFAQHKYIQSRVRVRAGTKVIGGESVCGVYVNVCLIFARLYSYENYSCGRTSIDGIARNITTLFDTSCCASSDEMISVDDEYTFNEPDAETSGCDTSAAFDNEDYINVPPCPTVDYFDGMEPEVLEQYLYQTSREVFIPNSDSVGCDPFTVVLSPSDVINQDCGEVPGQIPKDPDAVYWVWDDCSFFDDDPRVPAPSLVETLCGSVNQSPLHFAYFWDFCNTTAITGQATNILDEVLTGAFCASSTLAIQDLLDNQSYKKTVRSRSRGYLVDTEIVDGEVMFDELSDTWTLTIGSINCPPL